MKKKAVIAAIVVAAVLVIAVVAGLFLLPKGNKEDARDEKGEAKPSYAMDIIEEEFSGSSKIDSFVGASKAKGQADPVAYMIENSTFLLDQSSIEEQVADQLAGMESTANVQGVSVEEYLSDQGYDSVDAYTEKLTDDVTEFVKARMCVYEAARELGLSITEDEYEELLPEYASRYGYDDPDEFSYVCRPGTIACEMLYDKTVAALTGEQAEDQ